MFLFVVSQKNYTIVTCRRHSHSNHGVHSDMLPGPEFEKCLSPLLLDCLNLTLLRLGYFEKRKAGESL